MARDFNGGFKIVVYVRRVDIRRVVEREGVIKYLTVRYLMSPGDCRNAAVHAATFSHFRHIGPESGWVGIGAVRRPRAVWAVCGRCRLKAAFPGSREESARCRLSAEGRQALGPLGLSRPLRRCTGLRLKSLDQSRRGGASIWGARVGCGEMLNRWMEKT